MSQPDESNKQLEDVIVAYLQQHGGSVLRGRFFDVSSHEGKRVYAEWLAAELTAIDRFIENEYTEESVHE